MALLNAQSDVFVLLFTLIWLVVFGLLLFQLPADRDRKDDTTDEPPRLDPRTPGH